MQKTYLKMTAGTILKTARVAPSMSGGYEIWVTVPKMGECLASLQQRELGWGWPYVDVLHLENSFGDTVTLTTGVRSLAHLKSLTDECEQRQLSALRAEGYTV